MTDVEKLKEEELVKLQAKEVSLEELIVLGNKKKIPITIEYPLETGEIVKAKALIRQLTLRELEGVKLQQKTLIESNIRLLRMAFFKSNGDQWKDAELMSLPLGVINNVARKILEVSGVNPDTNRELVDF